MKKPQKKVTIIVLAFIGIVAASFFIGSRSVMIMQQASQEVSAVLSQILHTKIEVGQLHVVSPLQFKADGLVIYDKNDEKLAEADAVTIDIKAAALFNGDVAGSVDTIKAVKPVVHITKRENGTWNYTDLISSDRSQNNFEALIKAEKGTVYLLMDGKNVELDDVNADVDLQKNPQIIAKVDFKLGGTKVSATGSFLDGAKNLTVKADKLDIAQYLPLLPEGLLPENVTINGGTIENLNATVNLDGSELTYLQGKADIRDGSCKVMDTAVDKINSQLAFNKDYVTVFAKGNVADQTLNLHGKIGLSADPELSLKVQSDALNPKNILKDSPFDGDLSFSAAITGPVSAPHVQADLAAKDATAYGYAMHNAKVQGEFADNKLYIKSAAAELGKGKITGSGTYDLSDKSYEIHAAAKDLSCELLQDYLPGLTGNISAGAVLQGKSDDIDGLEGYANVSLTDASYQGIAVSKANAAVQKENKKIDVQALTLSFVGGGEASASGTIEDKNLNLEFYGSNVNLNILQQYLPLQISGAAAFYGHLQGNMDNPYLQLELAAADGEVMDQPYHSLRLSAIGNMDGVYIKKLTFKNAANEVIHQAHGIVGFKGSRVIDLTVDSKNARAENFVSLLAPDQPLTGNVDNTVHLTGTLDNITASGHVNLYEGSYRGMLITSAEGTYNYSSGNLRLQNFVVNSPFAALKIDGAMQNGNDLDFDVAIDDIDLAKMPSYLPYPISGKAAFRGHMSGSPDNIIFVSGLRAKTLNINGSTMHDVMGQLTYRDHILSIENAQWHQDDGLVAMQGRFNGVNGTMSGRLKADKVQVKSLASMLNIPDDYFTGIFNGTLDLSGTFIDPSIQLTGTVDDGYLKNYPLQKVSVDASYSDDTITINKLYGEQNNGKIAAKGTWAMHGNVDMEFSAQNIDAKLLTALANYSGDITGSMDAYAQVSGSSSSPEANISFALTDGGMGSTTFDKMTGLLNLQKGIINVNQILINKGQYRASAAGKVPLAALRAKPWEMLTNYEQIDLNVSLDNADLNIVPLLTKYVSWANGPLQGNLKINGTLAHPLFTGFVKMDQGSMGIKGMATPIQNMKADITFDREHMKVNDFSGNIGGGTYSLTGDTLITGGGLKEYNFSLNADKLSIKSDFYRGFLSGQFTLNEGKLFKKTMPKLAGNINIDKATISFPSIPDTNSSILPEMLLDVGINIGDDVSLYKSMLYDVDINGSAHFGGTSKHPMPSGEINVSRGTIEYLRNVFKIREGSAYFNQVGSFLPSIIFRASTNLGSARINLAVDGPVGNMSFVLTSDPQMSQEEIIKLLTFHTGGNESENPNTQDFAQLATIGLQMGFFNEVEDFMRDTLQLDEFNIVSDTVYDNNARGRQNLEDVYNIEVGKYISDKVMLKYRNSINYDERRFSMQYDISKNMSLVNEWDNKDGYRVGLEANIKF